MVILSCGHPACDFSTEDLTEATACVVLQSHASCHAVAQGPGPIRPQANLDGPKLTRPSVDVGVSLEAWHVFTRRWQLFVRGSGIADASASAQLFQCASPVLGDSLLQSDPDIVFKPVQELLSAMRRLAVIPIATGVLRSELRQMCQMRDEAFRAFAARVRGKADTCEFSATCSCGLKVGYTDHMIRDTLLSGIADDDIRREILGIAGILTSSINEIIALVESKEIARNATPTPAMSAVSAFRRQSVPPRTGERSVKSHLASSTSPDRSQQSHCPHCQRLYHLYKKGPRGWNRKPYSLCLDCHRSQRQPRRGPTPTAQSRPPTSSIQAFETHTGDSDPHLSTITKGPDPICDANRLDGDNTPATTSATTAVQQASHRVFQNGEWIKAPMREHPTVQVTISLDDHQYRNDHLSVVARGVTAVADTGAQTNVWSLRDFLRVGFTRDMLTPAPRLVAANRSSISIDGAFFAVIQGTSPAGDIAQCRAMIYVSTDVTTLYLSQDTLAKLGVLSPNFPSMGEHIPHDILASYPQQPQPAIPDSLSLIANDGCALPGVNDHPCSCPQLSAVPAPPRVLPFPCVPENIEKMKTWLLDRYAASTFNTCPHRALHCMAGPPIEIHVEPSAKPIAFHTPASIPLHWQQKVHEDILRDEALGILERVPHGEPTTWCHRMVITRKHDGTPRRTVDLSSLNKFCRQETFTSETPFKLARQIPSGTWKSVTDAWNGYHSVPLRKSDRHLTTFITPFGRWRYTRAPQGFLSSGDGYNRRFNAILTDFTCKERCVDDTVFYDENLDEHWWRTIEFLSIVGQAGIVLNPNKFQFSQKAVNFAGFRITDSCVEPLPKYLNAIREFPTPTNITDIRSWFGLINQIANYSQTRDLMAPFKPFLSPKHKFEWSDDLDRAFTASKSAIIAAIRHGVQIFDPTRRTCLRPDWSLRGIGYYLLQKHCACSSTIPDCCPSGWRVTLAGSRFLSSAEKRYAPIEGEALAVAWGLEQTKYFTQGCDNLVVVTDHKPLTKIFGDRTLDEITNTRLFRLKQRTLMWRFDIRHLPGTSNKAADAASRYPAASTLAAVTSHAGHSSPDFIEAALLTAVQRGISDNFALTWEDIARETNNDTALHALLDAIQKDFSGEIPEQNDIRQYLPFRESFYILDGVILYNDRVVIPPALRPTVLQTLHAAHQGVSAMERRARATVFWPGMTKDIHHARDSCNYCNCNAPSQAATPPLPFNPPSTPFEKIFADFFDYGGRHFLVVGDRLSGWSDVFATPTGSSLTGAKALVSLLRSYFATFGVPEELSSDGGPEFTASVTKAFLQTWGIHHRQSSAYFPQSNGRAEVAVKGAKRLLMANVSPNGDLNNDSFLRAMLQLRNTPDPDCDLSPAEIVFGRRLRDAFAFVNRLTTFSNRFIRRTWREAWRSKEDALRARAERTNVELYKGVRPLHKLTNGDRVLIQNQAGRHPRKWDKVGTVVEVLSHDQYHVKVGGSGRITKRNRRFLRLMPDSAFAPSPPITPPTPRCHPASPTHTP